MVQADAEDHSPRRTPRSAARIAAARDEERRRIARDIHDDLGGCLAALKMAMAQIRKELPPADGILEERLAYADELVDRTIEAAHRIALGLRPPMLDAGLVTALEWQAREFARQSGLRCEFASDSTDLALRREQADAIFHIVREALTNVGKHARASRVTLRLAHREHGIRIEVADDGAGIAPSDRLKPDSCGIAGMTARAAALGGDLSVSAAPAGGTVVALSLPLKRTVP